MVAMYRRPAFVRSIVIGCAMLARASHADGVDDDDVWRYCAGRVAIDAGFAVARPAALPTGLAKGVGAGITLGDGLQLGARASWATATEYAIGWTVTHDDLRVAVTAGGQRSVGRGSFGLRAGVGGVLVHETRRRVRGDVAGARGAALEMASTALLPAANLDAVIGLHISGAWMMLFAGGPSLVRVDGALHTGWTSHLGVAWQL